MSDTFHSSRWVNSYGPWISLKWELLRQEVENNRSQVRLTLYIEADRNNVYFSAAKSGVLNGSSFVYRGGMSGAGRRTLATRTLWINHNSDGTKSQYFSASFNPSITFSGQHAGNKSVGGTAILPRIARKSDFRSVSLSESLKSGGGGRINLDVINRPSGFYQWVGIYDGNTRVHDWGYNQSTPTWWDITSSIAKKLLGRITNSKSKDFTVRVYTYTGNGTGNLGYETQTLRANVSSREKPTINSTTLGINGDGWDKTNNMFVQGVSEATATMSSTPSHGASIASEQITIQGIRHNGTDVVSGILNDSGVSTVIYRATDSRGNYSETSRSLDVEPYSAPRFTRVVTERDTEDDTYATVRFEVVWDTLSNKNTMSISVYRRASGTNDWALLMAPSIHSGGTLADGGPTPGHAPMYSYDYRFVAEDLLGKVTEVFSTVPVAKVLFNIREDKGIGIGKMHEKGELDVAGDAFFEGNIEMEPLPGADRPGLRLVSRDLNGHSYVEFYGSDKRRKGYIGIPTASRGDVEIGSDNDVTIKADRLRMNPGDASSFYDFWHDGNVKRGRNSNGDWIKFPNGVMICYMFTSNPITVSYSSWGGMYRGFNTDTFPQKFIEKPKVILEGKPGRDASMLMNSYMIDNITNSTVKVVALTNDSRSNKILERGYIAIGRWK